MGRVLEHHAKQLLAERGIAVPRGEAVGAIGGERPERAFVPGRVGLMSRSGGLTSEVGVQLKRRGLRVSTAVSIGGDAMIGTSPADLLRRFAADDETDALVYVGEPDTRLEEDLAAALAEDLPKAIDRGRPRQVHEGLPGRGRHSATPPRSSRTARAAQVRRCGGSPRQARSSPSRSTTSFDSS